jgi:ABC-type sugar transport system ATPase subunit
MIAVENLTIRAGTFEISNVNIEIPTGQYAVLTGKTGSGKTTILEGICGLKPIVSGRIVLDGQDVTTLKPAERGIGYVPQDGALFVTMTVRDHLAYALAIRRWNSQEIAGRVDELADLLGITHLLHRRPKGLSGGERQRVALGRALAFKPTILCLDEPLSALDDDTRDEICSLLRSVQQNAPVTTLHVTHHWRETQQLADRILTLDNGAVIERRLEETTCSTS